MTREYNRYCIVLDTVEQEVSVISVPNGLQSKHACILYLCAIINIYNIYGYQLIIRIELSL